MHKFAILADDFTGANDTGVQLCKAGEAVRVILQPDQLDDDDTSVVIDTESRVVTGKEAYDRVYGSIKAIEAHGGCQYVYKKVDSTLRGHLQEEIQAAIDAYAPELIIFAPAYPVQGRTVREGRLYVHDVPLLETEIAADPRNPLTCDNVETLLSCCLPVTAHIVIADIERDELNLSGQAYTFDTRTNSHLCKIAQAALQTGKKVLWIGSAGLAYGLLQALRPKKPSLAIVGSISSKTMEQIAYCHTHGVNVMALPMAELFETQQLSHYATAVVTYLQNGQDVIVTGAQTRDDYEQFKAYGEARGISTDTLAEFTKQTLSDMASLVLSRKDIAGLFLTGGDTAIATITKLGAKGSQIERELLPGFVQGALVGGQYDGLPIVTKAGAFGTEKDIWECMMKLK